MHLMIGYLFSLVGVQRAKSVSALIVSIIHSLEAVPMDSSQTQSGKGMMGNCC